MNITDSFRHPSISAPSSPLLSVGGVFNVTAAAEHHRRAEPRYTVAGRGRVVTASAFRPSSSLPLLHARSLLFPSLLPPSIEMERGPPLARSNDLPGPTCGSRSCRCCCICRDDTQRWFHPKMHDNLKVTVVPFSNHTGTGNNVCET